LNLISSSPAPLIDLLRTHRASKTNAEMKAFLGPLASTVAKFLPELTIAQSIHDPIPELDPEAEKRRIFEAFVQILINSMQKGAEEAPLSLETVERTVPELQPTSRPMLVIIEDLHWSGGTGLELLHYLARRLARAPLPPSVHLSQQRSSPGAAALSGRLEFRTATGRINGHPLHARRSGRHTVDYIEWEIKARQFGVCNCDYGCPCQFNALPTHADCMSVTGYEIDEGYFGKTRLDGLRAVLIFKWPGPVHEGDGAMQAIIDQRADEAQREGLHKVLHGEESEWDDYFFVLDLKSCGHRSMGRLLRLISFLHRRGGDCNLGNRERHDGE
jgi:hypothetical protein